MTDTTKQAEPARVRELATQLIKLHGETANTYGDDALWYSAAALRRYADMCENTMIKVCCPLCNGYGKVRSAVSTAVNVMCPDCLGDRFVYGEPAQPQLALTADSAAQHNNAERKKQDLLILAALNAAQDDYSDAAKAYLIKTATEILKARTK